MIVEFLDFSRGSSARIAHLRETMLLQVMLVFLENTAFNPGYQGIGYCVMAQQTIQNLIGTLGIANLLLRFIQSGLDLTLGQLGMLLFHKFNFFVTESIGGV